MKATDNTTGLHLRALEPSDTDLLYLWENDPEMWRFGFSPAPLSRHQIWEYINQYDANPLATGQLRLMMHIGQITVGAIDLYNIDMRNRHAFVGIMTASQHRRNGYGSEALKLLISYCINNLGLKQLAATISADNKQSIALFLKAGFKITAELPDWIRRDGNTYITAKILTRQL